jgi:hypothetical protein
MASGNHTWRRHGSWTAGGRETKPMSIHCFQTVNAGIAHLNEACRVDLALPKIAIVNGSGRALELFESAPEFHRFTLLSLRSRSGAYSDIKRLRPSLVILCARPEDDDDACRLLTILKLDHQTCHIPVVTITTDDDDSDPDELDSAETSFAARN